MREVKSQKPSKEEIQSQRLFGTLQNLLKLLRIYSKKIDISLMKKLIWVRVERMVLL
jgi:hypothetical protein